MKLRDIIVNILIEHSQTNCPYCERELEIPDTGTEDAILEAVVKYLLLFPDDAIADEVRAIKKEIKEAHNGRATSNSYTP